MSGDNADNGGPVFPITSCADLQFHGLSLRDYFAARALTGILSCLRDHAGAETVETRARKAYEYADAMLAKRGAQP